jgi:hypothetical protein
MRRLMHTTTTQHADARNWIGLTMLPDEGNRRTKQQQRGRYERLAQSIQTRLHAARPDACG